VRSLRQKGRKESCQNLRIQKKPQEKKLLERVRPLRVMEEASFLREDGRKILLSRSTNSRETKKKTGLRGKTSPGCLLPVTSSREEQVDSFKMAPANAVGYNPEDHGSETRRYLPQGKKALLRHRGTVATRSGGKEESRRWVDEPTPVL